MLILNLNGRKISCSLAVTPAAHALGLQKHAKLAADEGLLFVFERAGTKTFWMGDVKFPIDIIGIGEDARVTKIVSHARPGASERWTLPKCAAVLEIPAGGARHAKLKIGDPISLHSSPRSHKEGEAFHGTYSVFELIDPDRSGLGAHFGTYTAAAERLNERDLVPSDGLVTDARVILYDLDVKNPLLMPDMGHWEYGVRLRQAVYNALGGYSKILDKNPKAVEQERHDSTIQSLRKLIEGMGYDSVVYANDVEDKGSWSYIVWNPKLIHKLDETKLEDLVTNNDTSGTKRFGPTRVGPLPNLGKASEKKQGQIVDDETFVQKVATILTGRIGKMQWAPDRLNGGATERTVIDRALLASWLGGGAQGPTGAADGNAARMILDQASDERGLRLIGDAIVLTGVADFVRMGFTGSKPVLVAYRVATSAP